jgi:penicillin-binding protein 2
MAVVPTPIGTDNSAHLEGIDFAGKTGSAQTMSNALAAKLGHSHSVKDNAWFVGFAPRRNPDIAVCVLFEAGEHGKLAGRLAAQVIEAYVDKQRMLQHNLIAQTPKPVQVGALWSNPVNPNELGGKPLPATAGQAANPELASVRGGHFTVPAQAAAH